MNTIDFTVQIARRKVAVTAMYENTKNFCAAYLCDGEPHFSVTTTPEDLRYELEASLREDAIEGHPPRKYTDTYLESIAVQRKITEHLFEHDTLLFHGSAVAVDGSAYLFVAKSGTGKSTHTRLWRQLLGNRAVMVNDDKPFLEISKDQVIAHGSPWNGVHRLGNNISVPVKAICILERGEINQIEQITSKESLFMLLQQSSRPKSKALIPKYMELLDTLSKNVNFYLLHCNTNIEAAQIAYETMSK